ncbi:MAG: prepilin-type N-terminal cleavage/methylation domain-containing protein [Candidatus Nealsonbacteria bacterium]
MPNKGFTLIEVVIALFIISMGTLAAFSLMQQALAFTSVSSSRLTAAYLAQEGVEITRNLRDNNWLQELAWDQGLTSCGFGCEADYTDITLSSWIEPGQFLKLDENFLYNYDSGNDTFYKRKITVVAEGLDILNVSVNVLWEQRGSSHEITAETKLYNWR